MFTITYRPKRIEEFVGNKQIIQPFIKWLLEWNCNDKNNKCALISGLCGIGKSLLVELILKKHDYNIINLAIDDERNKDYMNNVIKPLIKTKNTYDGQENILVVSEIDCGSDYGFISSLNECIKETKIPIVCICDNRYDQGIKLILNYCFDLKMIKPSYQDVYCLIYKIIINEKIKIKESEIKEMYEQSNGDIRFILNNLQFGLRISNKIIQNNNIFDTTCKLLLIDESIDKKYETFWLSKDLHPLMVQENYISNTLGVRDEIKKLENISYSADALSDLDICDNFVNKINWDIEPYVALNTIRAALKCNKKSLIKFSRFLEKVSIMNKNKRENLDYENVKFFVKEKSKVKKEKTRRV
jgi:replication factor C subunit 1